MAIQQRCCTNHPERAAIGICVLTRKPICSECSTRYEGVNYSKEGLQLLRQQRAAAARAGGRGAIVLAVLGVCLSPAMCYLVYASYAAVAQALMAMLHQDY